MAVSAAVSAVATVVLVAITGYYAVTTGRILETTRSQNFAVSFHQLLEAHRRIASEVTAQVGNGLYRGQEAFRMASGEILGGYSNALAQGAVADQVALINALYSKACHSSLSDFSHYFRTLYYLMQFIRDSGLSARENARFEALIRARMSTVELELCLYNALSEYGERGFAKLATSLHLFMGMRLDHKLVEEHLVLFKRLQAGRAA